MPAHTAADVAQLVAVYADRVLVSTTRDVHRAVASRVFGLTGQRHTPVGVLHDVISGGVYAAVGLATRTLGRMGDLGVGVHTDLDELRRGRRVRSIVNGFVGDVLADGGSPSAVAPAFRRDARDIALDPAALAAAFPDATERLVVFVHGLCNDDECWSYRRDERGPTYLERLRGAGRWTPIALRYNSGEPVRSNAATLTGLVDELVDVWPLEVREVAFVGHSMGGLVVRAAAASASGRWWSERVAHVVLLGSPHGGAPLERLVKRAVPSMRRLPEAAPFATILDERSIGIRDLHDGIGPTRWSGGRRRTTASVPRSVAARRGCWGGCSATSWCCSTARAVSGRMSKPTSGTSSAHIISTCSTTRSSMLTSSDGSASPSTPPCGRSPPQRSTRSRRWGSRDLTSRAAAAARAACRCAAGRRADDPGGAG